MIDRIRQHPAYHQLATERARLGHSLAAITALAYFAFILTVALRPTALGVPLYEGAVITWGIVLGAALLGLGFILTAIYVAVANARFDALTQRLREDV
jgi:uncharacterized membrane protein (DUF485 family)